MNNKKLIFKTIDFIRELHKKPSGSIPLHAPVFIGKEREYLNECIDSTFVSSVGKYVDKFEDMICEFTGAKRAIATVNGTSALHIALKISGIKANDEVLTQPLTFIATANAISYTGAHPIFIDVDCDTLGLSPKSLEHWLNENSVYKDGKSFNLKTGNHISTCVPMHTFGFPCRIEEIVSVCSERGINVIEDAAESLGSFVGRKHTGLFGKLGILSFNGNKIVTTGGGGMIITDDNELADLAKHITTTAKVPHLWEYRHDMIGYNYRMPNINAALGCAQMESMCEFLKAKRLIAERYFEYFKHINEIRFIKEPSGTRANYWLNTIILEDKNERDVFLKMTNENKVNTRPIWTLMNQLEMYKNNQCGELTNSNWLEKRILNLPSGVNL